MRSVCGWWSAAGGANAHLTTTVHLARTHPTVSIGLTCPLQHLTATIRQLNRGPSESKIVTCSKRSLLVHPSMHPSPQGKPPSSAVGSRGPCARQANSFHAGGPPLQGQAFHDAYTEAAQNKTRMRGSQDLIAGNYLLGDSAQAARQGNLPPRPVSLLPEAHMKVACAGGSAAALSSAEKEYLNSMVQAQTNRERNEYPRMKSLIG